MGNTKGTALWDAVFLDNEWAEDLRATGVDILLVSHGTAQPYVILFLAHWKEPVPAFATQLRSALRSQKEGAVPYEIVFNDFTLNISQVLFPGSFVAVESTERFWKSREVCILQYRGGSHSAVFQTPFSNLPCGFLQSQGHTISILARLGRACGAKPIQAKA